MQQNQVIVNTFLKKFFKKRFGFVVFVLLLTSFSSASAQSSCNAWGDWYPHGSYINYWIMPNNSAYMDYSTSDNCDTRTHGQFYCNNGALEGWYPGPAWYPSCNYNNPTTNIYWSPSTINKGQSSTIYSYSTGASSCWTAGSFWNGSAGTSNGYWSGNASPVINTKGTYYQDATCYNPTGGSHRSDYVYLTVLGDNCSSPWGTVSDGYSNTAYLTSTADICWSQTRTCNDGTMSGSYTYTSCTVNQYSITFNSAGGSAVSTITQNYGTAVTPPAAPTRAGYTFTGWSPSIAATMPSGGQALTATWSLNLPVVNTPTVTSVSYDSASMGANLASGVTITARGTCWGTTAAPTSNCQAEGATSTGVYTQARTSLPLGTLIYIRGYATNATGTAYSSDISTTTLKATTTMSEGVNPSSVTVSPGSAALFSNSFVLQTSLFTDVLSQMTVKIGNASSTSLLEVTNDSGTIVYGSVSNPTGTSTSVTLNTNTLTVTTTPTQYKIRITPKSQANLPSGSLGMLYPVTTLVTSWTGGTNNKTGSDATSSIITIDNQAVPSFAISTSSISFATKVDYAAAGTSYFVDFGDFNNDSYSDLVTSNNSTNNASVFINNGNGMFATKVDYTTGSGPYGVVVGDFNSDGYTDFATNNYSSNNVSVLLNNGNGTFATKVDYTTGSGPWSIDAADFNGDGNIDLIVPNNTANTVSVLMNNGNGTFATKVDYTTGSGPRSVISSDFNNDGKKDFAISNYSANTFSIFINNGNGTFATKVDYGTAIGPYGITSADLNLDGNNDIVLVNGGSASASVFLNNGNGTFATKVDYTTGTDPRSVAVGDYNNDGKKDFATANVTPNTASVFLNNGNGTFATKVDYTTGTAPFDVIFADVNNDGKSDLLSANYTAQTISVFSNTSQLLLTGTSSIGQATISYTTPFEADYAGIVILRSSSPITSTLVDGAVYAGGDTVGSSTVACVDTATATSTSRSCTATGLTGGATYYFKAYVKDTYGNYSIGASTTPATVVPQHPTLPTFTNASTTVTSIGTSTATISAYISSDGGGAISARGTCWGTSPSPATNCSLEGGTGTGLFSHVRTGFTASTTYYVRAYVTNATGTAYSSDVTFTTLSINDPSDVSVTAGYQQATINYTNPGDVTLNSIIIVKSTSTIGTLLTNGVSYNVGDNISSSVYVACKDTTVTPGAVDSCIATGLTNGIPYYFKVFSRNASGNYSPGVAASGSPATPSLTTVLGNGTNPSNTTIAPGGAATFVDSFTFQTATTSEVISAVVVAHTNASSTSLLEITNSTGSIVYGSVVNPTGATTSVTLSTNTLTASTALNEYKIRITPKTQANLPSGALGQLYPVTATISSWTGSNTKSGADTSSATITVDNFAPSEVSSNSVLPGSTKAVVNYTLPTDTDVNGVIVLRSTSAITDTPVDGSTYSAGNTIGSSVVACADYNTLPSALGYCKVSGLSNGVQYYFKVFTRDMYGNYSIAGNAPIGSPVTPAVPSTSISLASYRLRNDNGTESTATYSSAENTVAGNSFIVGDKIRVRFTIANQTAITTIKSYQIEYATSTCMNWVPVPKRADAVYEDWKMEPSAYVADGSATTHSSGLTVPGGKSFTSGKVQTFNRVTAPITLLTGEYSEIEFSIRSTNYMQSDTNYCFKLTNQGEDSDFIYSQTPQITPLSRIFRYYGGGGGAGYLVNIDVLSAATTTTTGGGASSTQATSTPGGDSGSTATTTTSTTTPSKGGGGGDVGFNFKNGNMLAISASQGVVLGETVSTDMCVDFPSNFGYGSNDEVTYGKVSELQEFLRIHGYYQGKLTGYYYSKTKEALRMYQKENNILPTGLLGPITRKHMNQVSCLK